MQHVERAATPLVVAGVSEASGLLISGTQSVTSQYVQTGDWSKTDWLSVGKEALIGGAEGFVTGYIGGAAGTALTNALGKTALAGSLLNSTSTVTRVASHAVIGSISQIGTGMTARFAGSILTNGLDIQKSTKAAFNLQGILMDGAIGGIFGGVQGVKQPQVSPQVQEVNGVGEGASVTNKSGVKSIDSLTQSDAGGVNKGGGNTYGEAHNVVNYAKYKEVLKTTEAANPLVESLRSTGELPQGYTTKAGAMEKGWIPGKALDNYIPGCQIGGDEFLNTTRILPKANGRVWYEADVGLNNTISRAKQPGTRLVYSNDGLMYVTYDHYETVHAIGTWK